MSFVGLLVEKPGPLSLIQDFGRFGLAHIGITQSGPVDDYAYSWSNHCLLYTSPSPRDVGISRMPSSA